MNISATLVLGGGDLGQQMEGYSNAIRFNKNRRNYFFDFGVWIFGWLSSVLAGCSDPVREFGSIIKDPDIKAAMIAQMKTYQLEGSVHDPAIRIFMGYCFEVRVDGIDASGRVLGAANSVPVSDSDHSQ